jgi:hypothetical protein
MFGSDDSGCWQVATKSTLAWSLRGDYSGRTRGELTVSKVTTLVRTLELASDRRLSFSFEGTLHVFYRILPVTNRVRLVQMLLQVSPFWIRLILTVVERLKRLQVAMFNAAMQLLNRVSSVDRVSSLDDQENVVRIPVSLRDISVVWNFQTGCGIHLASY